MVAVERDIAGEVVEALKPWIDDRLNSMEARLTERIKVVEKEVSNMRPKLDAVHSWVMTRRE